jgi:hypothetical protein
VTVPTAPLEAGGDKLLFLVYDLSGTNAPALLRAYQQATVNGEVVGDLGVYSTSGTLENGAKSIETSAAIAISSTAVPCQGVLVKAHSDNAGTVYVGKSAVTADKTEATGGYPLEPGESVGVPCRDASTVFIRGTVADSVAWLASADVA